MSKNGDAAGLLRSLRDRIVRLEEEKKSIAEDIKDVYAEAKANGFDVKALRIVVKRAMEDASQKAQRCETEELAELYLANLGALDGTPLGDAARKRILPTEPEPREPDKDDGDDGAQASRPEDQAEPSRGAFTAEDLDAARERGASDHTGGKRVIDNPFVAGDPRRAAWDEGYCREAGSDGMEIPEAWRRKPKPTPEKGADA
jgi:uncharacterized protein (UPF0335 family)